MSDEALPEITIGGRQFRPTVMDLEYAPDFQDMTLADLCALVAALPEEEQWRVIRAMPRSAGLVRKLAIAEENYQFMVDRAANQKLDGYRELGQRAADAENRRDEALAENARLREELADWKRWADVVCTMSAPASRSFLRRPDETEKS